MAGDVDGVVVVNEACHSKKRVMSHIWMSHVTRRNESWHTYEGVMSQIERSHVTHVRTTPAMPQAMSTVLQLRHVTRMDESCHTYEGVMSHV